LTDLILTSVHQQNVMLMNGYLITKYENLKLIMMKTSYLILLLSFVFSGLSAQSAREEVDFMQSVFGMEKKALVAEFVKPGASQEDAFWQLYDEYETARKELGRKRIDLLLQYEKNFESLSNDLAGELLKESLALAKKNDKLLASYVKKVGKAAGPVVAMQFHQVEVYILSEIRVALAGGLPLPEVKR